jgi:hypothetical protein
MMVDVGWVDGGNVDQESGVDIASRRQRSKGKNENVDRDNRVCNLDVLCLVHEGFGAQLSGLPCGPQLCAGPGLFKEPKRNGCA